MNEYEFKFELAGNSGCKIYLMENADKKRIIRKFSKSIDYNERLKLQCEKQKNFSDPVIKTPKVLTCGTDDRGLFYFDMEYIRGVALSEYMRMINVNEIANVVDMLTSNIENVNGKTHLTDSQAFQNKIYDLKQKIDTPLMLKGLNLLQSYSWENFPQTFCHGDLTLENIMVCQGNLYFIDFLDSFYDSFILDISTLLQDVHCMWHYRFEKNLDVNTKIRLMIFRDLLMQKISACGISSQDVYCALLLKLIRIYPYVKDSATQEFLSTKVDSVIKLIRKL